MECGIFVATVFGMCWRFGCEGDLLAGSVAGGYGGQPLKAGGAAQPGLLCLLCACGVPGLGGAVPEKGVFGARGVVLLLKMVVCGGVATWNAGFLSQRCLGCVRDLGVRGLDWDVCGWT